jgi:magnesium chelatase subunit I
MKDLPTYPFVAIVGQGRMKLALILNVIHPGLSGVLIRGEKGTAKSTAVRALAAILPEIEVFADDPFNLDPRQESDLYREIAPALDRPGAAGDEPPATVRRKVAVVELPVGSTEDRVAGTLDLEHALQHGRKRVEPGLLAAAHRGILYVDEVNLLEDHIVDVLLDSAAMGVNTVEREGISFTHPARFTLVGTMNPEEGELRPQLLDRFGLCVNIEGIAAAEQRVAIMERRAAFDDDPEEFGRRWEAESRRLADRIRQAKALYPRVAADKERLYEIARYCLDVGVDGHRGDIIMLKTAKVLAAFDGRPAVGRQDIRTAAELVLPHRVRRQPLMEIADNVETIRRRAATAANGSSKETPC